MENSNIPKTTPKDVFLHLFAIVTLYLSVVSFMTLYVQYINVIFPDPLTFYYRSVSEGIRVSMAILLIALPAYLISSWFLKKDDQKNILHREIKIRKWLVYLTLFVSAVTVIIDLMILVYNFLNGELSTQFFLKILVVLLVAAALFLYYFWDLKNENIKSKLPVTIAATLLVIMVASIVWGFFLIGAPSQQRDHRFDEQRVQDLQLLQSQIINYWQNKEVLPTELSQLENDISGYQVANDPETKADYQYQVLGDLSFELCADFTTNSEDFVNGSQAARYYYPSIDSQNWEHKSEKTCFERTIDPELYKNNSATKQNLID
ncbi:hypothetical protein H6761_01615 [Candidatus Nomurabacteria bacterium]|nr:hypothetical protein [Candidatus Nomurabacteria bacterium]